MLRSVIKSITPAWLRERRRAMIVDRSRRRFGAKSTAEVFEQVYRDAHWGRGGTDEFYSGLGSHDEAIVGPYVAAVREFLKEGATPPDVVDLGCGDFNVGAQLRDAAGGYVAGDIVASLIERNRTAFADRDVDFRVIDIVADELPAGDVVLVRQVLQHLSNAHIATVLEKLRAFRWAVVTEHLTPVEGFVPNLDIVSGPRIRTDLRSAVVLEAPPFELESLESRVLCEVEHETGVIKTTAFRFR